MPKGFWRAVRDAGDIPILDKATVTASFNSTAFSVPATDWIGVFMEVTDSAGTSQTIVAQLQFSFDGGTTWTPVPATFNSNNAASLTQAEDGLGIEYWRNPFGAKTYTWKGTDYAPKLRVGYVVSGTSPSFTLTSFVFGKTYGGQ